MLCPYCLHKNTKVIDKRDFEDTTKRRRECLKCSKRFNTHEKSEKLDLRVVKKDGLRQGFDEDKLKKGILRACEKRHVQTEKIDKIVAKVVEKLMKKGKEVDSFVIGDLVSRELKKLDTVAYIRFASVYRDFKDIEDFRKEIRGLKN